MRWERKSGGIIHDRRRGPSHLSSVRKRSCTNTRRAAPLGLPFSQPCGPRVGKTPQQKNLTEDKQDMYPAEPEALLAPGHVQLSDALSRRIVLLVYCAGPAGFAAVKAATVDN
eukprot:5174755-Pyramimonas_sp.AAC.1